MAALTVTAANVGVSGTGVTLQVVQVFEAVTQGMGGYLATSSPNSGKYGKTDCNSSAESATAAGVFMTAASADGYAILATGGPINLGATLTVGEVYVIGDANGAIHPVGDVTTNWYVTTLGIALTASKLQLDISVSGILAP